MSINRKQTYVAVNNEPFEVVNDFVYLVRQDNAAQKDKQSVIYAGAT